MRGSEQALRIAATGTTRQTRTRPAARASQPNVDDLVWGSLAAQRSIAYARRLMAEAGVDFPLVHASAEEVPAPAARFQLQALIELRLPTGAQTTYVDCVPYDWARNWPGEHLSVARKA